LPHQWKESTTVPTYNKGDKINCNNYRGIPLLPTANKILSSKANYIHRQNYGHHQCVFQCNGATTDQIFCVRQILEKKWECEHNGTVHKVVINFKKAYDLEKKYCTIFLLNLVYI